MGDFEKLNGYKEIMLLMTRIELLLLPHKTFDSYFFFFFFFPLEIRLVHVSHV